MQEQGRNVIGTQRRTDESGRTQLKSADRDGQDLAQPHKKQRLWNLFLCTGSVSCNLILEPWLFSFEEWGHPKYCGGGGA
jgi:hypothetical protein